MFFALNTGAMTVTVTITVNVMTTAFAVVLRNDVAYHQRRFHIAELKQPFCNIVLMI